MFFSKRRRNQTTRKSETGLKHLMRERVRVRQAAISALLLHGVKRHGQLRCQKNINRWIEASCERVTGRVSLEFRLFFFVTPEKRCCIEPRLYRCFNFVYIF
jgi:hypothetical protein